MKKLEETEEILKCKWKEIAESSRKNILPIDSICYKCSGHDTTCDYYIDNFPENEK